MADYGILTQSETLSYAARSDGFTAPVISGLTPDPGSLAVGDVLEFDLSVTLSGGAVAEIRIDYSNDARRFVVHDGAVFLPPFDTYSTRTGSGPYHFRLRPDGGWQEGVGVTLTPRTVLE
jgi:hypothetical protein